MSAASLPIPLTLQSSRTIACGPVSGARSSRSARVFSIELICSRTSASRAMSRRHSSMMFAGTPVTPGGHVAPDLLDDVCRQARALRCPQTCQTLRRLAQMRLESPNPETGERSLHAVGDALALVDKALALAARAPRILLLHRRDRHHPAVPPPSGDDDHLFGLSAAIAGKPVASPVTRLVSLRCRHMPL